MNKLLLAVCGLGAALAPDRCLSSEATRLASPNGRVELKVAASDGRLEFGVSLDRQPVIEDSPMNLTLDGVELTQGAEISGSSNYQINETYPCLGGHSQATNYCNGTVVALRHTPSGAPYALELRAYDDGAAFRFIIPGGTRSRVPDEATTFRIPAASTVWYHGLNGHYEGVHAKRDVSAVREGEWAAPPVTFKLPRSTGYAALTEAALVDYAGMAFQADGRRGLRIRLGHSHPASYPYVLRYGTNEAVRLSRPAALTGTITTPWRVVLVAPDLNILVNADVVPDLCPPPDPRLFPKGALTDWIRPGRAVWKYLDGGGSNSLATMKEFTQLAAELGFEHHVVEGFWSRWTDAQIQELVDYGRGQHVGIWLWKHSRTLRDPAERRQFLRRCHQLGVTGVKIDFFDHEAKEVIDLYQALLRETAENHLLVNFHGANKPTGEMRTWPNELTREAVRGMEASRLEDRATHDVTLPFTRFIVGPADYTPMHFGPRRGNTTWGHQLASAVIFSGPLLTYAAHPLTILTNPCASMIKSIPATYDQTVVLPPSEIGELAVFARRSGPTWFLAIMNGAEARTLKIPLSFLGKGDYRAVLVRDNPDRSAAQTELSAPLREGSSLTVQLQAGGGFLARFSP